MDADEVCRGFYESGEPSLVECIRNLFGKDMFFPDGSVDRKKLGGELFLHPEKMKSVTGVIYPLLTEKLCSAIAACRKNGQNGAFELPLLYEADFALCFDAVLSVWCPPGLRRSRLRNRNFTPEEVDRRDRMQMPPEEKMERADFAVINSGSPEMLNEQLKKLAEAWEEKQ